MRVFVTGASGLVGRRVIPELQTRHEVVAISRNKDRLHCFNNVQSVEGDVTKRGQWQDVASSCDAIVHLAGAGIMDKRWSTSYKAELRRSRIDSTRNCAEVGAGVLVSASATGIYGDRGEEVLAETSSVGDDFLSRLAIEWEASAHESEGRVVTLRFGMILDKDGGAMKKMKLPFQCGLGGPIGSGKQYWPWIHSEDVCNIVLCSLEEQWTGAFNVVAPEQVNCSEFVTTLGKVLRRPAIAPMPKVALRLLIGEASGVLTASQRVIPKRLEEQHFQFQFPDLNSALNNLIMS